MEQREAAMELLDHIVAPGFCVIDNVIVKTNTSAQNLLVETGTDVRDLLLTGKDEYAAFQDGSLCLTVRVSGQNHSATVHRKSCYDLFLFDQDKELERLQPMELVSMELRDSLNCAMNAAQQLSKLEDASVQEHTPPLNRSLMQMLRTFNNISDANHNIAFPAPRLETQEVSSFLEKIFLTAGQKLSHSGTRVTFQGLPSPLFCLIDAERLAGAVRSILSNAATYAPSDGTIDATLTRNGNKLILQVVDNGPGISGDIKSTLHCRYQRQPSIEEGRLGLGLGMLSIRTAAECHGGTLLVDQPEGSGTRVTMTLMIRQNSDHLVRSSTLPISKAGGKDPTLVEFSEILPSSLYKQI